MALTALIFVLAIRLCYWVILFSKLGRYKASNQNITNSIQVSIVVCVKDNAKGLANLIPKLLKQNYPHFEVIIVDDYSSDELNDLVSRFDNAQKLRVVKAAYDHPGKKVALDTGIKNAKFDWILMTDSDCMPSSLDWIKHMTNNIYDHTDLVLGYAPLKSGNSFAAWVASYETAYICMQYFSYALHGMPYMGVGRNLLVRKSIYLAQDPFADNLDLASGDDDVLVSKLSNGSNTQICVHHNAYCYSEAASTWSGYLAKKTRHVSTTTMYPKSISYLLGIFAFAHLMLYLLSISMLIIGYMSNTVAALLLVYWSISSILQYPIFRKINEEKLMFRLIPCDVILSIFYSFVFFKSLTSKDKTQWS